MAVSSSGGFRVNWRVFDTPVLRSTVTDFGNGTIPTYQRWINACGSANAKKEIRGLRTAVGSGKVGVACARTRAKKRARSFA